MRERERGGEGGGKKMLFYFFNFYCIAKPFLEYSQQHIRS